MPGARKRILIVDRDPKTAAAMARAITDAGLEATSVKDKAGALAEFARARPAAILVSVDLGDEDGRTVCTAIRGRPEGSVVPILFFGTGEPNQSVRTPSEALAVGGDYFFRMPIDYGYLASRVMAWTGTGDETHSAPESAKGEIPRETSKERSAILTRKIENSVTLAPNEPIDVAALRLGDGPSAITEMASPLDPMAAAQKPIAPKTIAAKPIAAHKASLMPWSEDLVTPLADSTMPSWVAEQQLTGIMLEETRFAEVEDARDLVRRGEELRASGDLDSAIDAYQAAAGLYEKVNRGPAIALYKLILHLDPSRIDIAKRGAQASIAEGRKHDAHAIYRQCAIALESAGDLFDATEILRRMVSIEPEDGWTRLKLSELEQRMMMSGRIDLRALPLQPERHDEDDTGPDRPPIDVPDPPEDKAPPEVVEVSLLDEEDQAFAEDDEEWARALELAANAIKQNTDGLVPVLDPLPPVVPSAAPPPQAAATIPVPMTLFTRTPAPSSEAKTEPEPRGASPEAGSSPDRMYGGAQDVEDDEEDVGFFADETKSDKHPFDDDSDPVLSEEEGDDLLESMTIADMARPMDPEPEDGRTPTSHVEFEGQEDGLLDISAAETVRAYIPPALLKELRERPSQPPPAPTPWTSVEPRGASPEVGSGPDRMYGGAQDVRREPPAAIQTPPPVPGSMYPIGQHAHPQPMHAPPSMLPQPVPQLFPEVLSPVPLFPERGEIEHGLDALMLLGQIRSQRSTGLLRVEDGSEIVFADGQPSALRGAKSGNAFADLVLETERITPEAIRDLLRRTSPTAPYVLGRALIERHLMHASEAYVLLDRQLEEALAALLVTRARWWFDVDGDPVLRDELIPQPREVRDRVLDLVPRSLSLRECVDALGGTRAIIRVSGGFDGVAHASDRRFLLLLDGRARLSEAIQLSAIAPERGAAMALVYVMFGLATVFPTRAREGTAPTLHGSATPSPPPLDPIAKLKAFADRTKSSDYFAILGVRPNAEPDEIREAHRVLRMELRLDELARSPDLLELAREVRRSLDEARDVLLVPELRAQYQQHLKPRT